LSISAKAKISKFFPIEFLLIIKLMNLKCTG